MFCPKCGLSQGDELKFCKSCGANLYAVRQAAESRETGEKFDWSKTWLSEMLLSQDEQKRRKRERERQDGITPEERRFTEIKAGVITSCVGLSVMIFLYVFMQGIIATGIPPNAAEIISRVWIAGIIPFFVGLGLMFNGLFVSKKLAEITRRELQRKDTTKTLESAGGSEDRTLSSADWYSPDSPRASVTEHTTRQLDNHEQTK